MALTVVLADDNDDHRATIRLLLELASDALSIVGEAADGIGALDLVRQERPDLVIADVVMPDLDGLALTALVKHERPETKVIVMSGYGGRSPQSVATRSGADAYVSKAEISRTLLPAIRAVLDRGV